MHGSKVRGWRGSFLCFEDTVQKKRPKKWIVTAIQKVSTNPASSWFLAIIISWLKIAAMRTWHAALQDIQDSHHVLFHVLSCLLPCALLVQRDFRIKPAHNLLVQRHNLIHGHVQLDR